VSAGERRPSAQSEFDVAIVGAGISGLSAAYELRKRGISPLIFERSDRAGGVIQTERIGEFVIDAGPDSLLVQKPAAVALCDEIGLGDRLFPTKVPRTAFVLRHGTLHPLPGASMLGFPTRIRPMLASRLFSTPGKIRMGVELLLPKQRKSSDESIASFVRRRFGREAVTYIAEPLLAGIHAGDVERLSMRALFPRLLEAEDRTRSVILAFRRMHAARNTDGVFRSFPNGLAELVDGMLRKTPRDSIHLNATVTRVERDAPGFVVHVEDRAPVRARAVILTCPAFAVGDVVQPMDAELARLCGSIRYLSSATVAFAFPRNAVSHDLLGTGFVVPRSEGLNITAGAWISSKWPHRAPEGFALLRAFLGGARDPDVLTKSDRELSETALRELGGILGIHGAPLFSRVYRWKRSSPQLEVGHLDLMAKIDSQLATHPGLFVSAAGFRGVGIPDCVGDARATAASAEAYLKQTRMVRT
jgi:oxygen-dependent protoporphyrinogen oxidase